IVRHVLAHHVGPRREHLAELDEARPQRLERLGEPLPPPTREGALPERCRAPDEERRYARAFERKQRVVARERARDADEAPDVSERADHAMKLSPRASRAATLRRPRRFRRRA